MLLPSGGPFSLVINGVTYPGITPGTPFQPQSSEDNLFGAEVPLIPAFPDATLYELGVKFSVSANGFIKGIRFYKGALVMGLLPELSGHRQALLLLPDLLQLCRVHQAGRN